MKQLAIRALRKVKRLISIRAWGEAHIGGGDFRAIGQEFLDHFITAGLKPHHDVLDIGCGIGRMAQPLSKYLSGGSYTGVDVSEKAIRYCRSQFKLGNFRFIHADLYNQSYNPRGERASRYRIPFPARSFDFVFLTSVFTHLLREEVENYMGQIAHVLRPGGICFATWFLLKDIQAMKIPMTRLDDICAVKIPEEPTAAIAYAADFVEALYSRNGLSIRNVFLGYWARDNGVSWQDIVIADSLAT